MEDDVASVTLLTDDGEHLDAGHVPDAGRGLAVVLAHGFTGSWRNSANLTVLRHLAQRSGVLAFDFRGHGRSTGHSTVGDREVLDVQAAVAWARAAGYAKVATLGFSMGAASVLRHAGLIGGVDAVISVSAPARWYFRGTAAMRRVHFAIERPLGRAMAARLFGTRIAAHGWDPVPESPEQIIARIPPTPLLLVHGDADDYFPVDHLESLVAAAGTGIESWLVPGFGHAENAVTSELLSRLDDWLVGHA